MLPIMLTVTVRANDGVRPFSQNISCLFSVPLKSTGYISIPEEFCLQGYNTVLSV
jgi:hypothetical protein